MIEVKQVVSIKKLTSDAIAIHKGNLERGFWTTDTSIGKVLMMAIGELCEGLEADRKGRYANIEEFHANEKLHGFKEAFELSVKDTLQDEIADTYIRLLDYFGYLISKNRITPSAIIDFDFGPAFSRLDDIGEMMLEISHAIKMIKTDHSYFNHAFVGLAIMAQKLNIDLEWHIENKLKYNATRSFRHGNKRY